MVYKCKHFRIEELVDQQTFKSNPEWKLWIAFDDRLLKAIDFLREELDTPITINNWLWGGDRQWSGLRHAGGQYYSRFSSHSYGRAVDMLFTGISAERVRGIAKNLIANGKMEHINHSFTFEERKNGKQISWVHMSVQNNGIGYNGFSV